MLLIVYSAMEFGQTGMIPISL